MRVFNMLGLPQLKNNRLCLLLEEAPNSDGKLFNPHWTPKQSELTAQQIGATGDKFCIFGALCSEGVPKAMFISNEATEGEFFPPLSRIQYHAFSP